MNNLSLVRRTLVFIFIFSFCFACSTKKGFKKEPITSPWEMFQNNTSRTAYTSYPSITSPSVEWKKYIGIMGYLNCPVLANNIFVTSQGKKHNESDEMDGVYAISKSTGVILWHLKTENDAGGISYSEGKLYTTGDDGILRCVDADSGKQIWAITRPGELYCHPLIIDDLVIIGDSAGMIKAFNKNNASEVWSVNIGKGTVRSALTSDGVHIYSAHVEGGLACLDLTGKVLWQKTEKRKKYSGFGKVPIEIFPSPTIVDNLLIIGFARDTHYENPAIHAYNKETGSLIWKSEDPNKLTRFHGNIRTSVAVYKDLLLYANPYSNHVIAIDQTSGIQQWNIRGGASMFPQWGSPVIADRTLYIGKFDGSLHGINLDLKKTTWQLDLSSSDKVILRNPTFGFEEPEDTGDWYPSNGEPIFATPALDQNGDIYIGTGEGYLYKLVESELK